MSRTRILFLASLLFLIPGLLRAQTQTANLLQSFTTITSSSNVGLSGTNTQFNMIQWWGFGTLSTCKVKLEQSATGTGGWSDLISEKVCTANGLASIPATPNYVRITVTDITGGGRIDVRYTGFNSSPLLTSTAGYTTVEDEGVAQTQRSTVNFTGSGVTCSDDGSVTVCDMSAAGGGGTPGGSDTQLQYNNSSSFGGVSKWTTNGTTTLTGISTAILDASAAATFKPPQATAPTVEGTSAFNTTTHLPVWGFNGASTTTIPTTLSNASHKWINSYTQSTGAFTQTQPDYSDLTGTPTLAMTMANVSHKWLNSYDSATGLFTQTQPDYADLTGVPSSSTTVNSQTCTLGSTCTIPFQTNSGNNTSQAGINLLTSTANSVGLTVTPVNSGTNQEKFEITGSSYTGNSATTTKWANARNLAGNSVDGSGNVAFSNKFVVQGTVDSGLSGAQFLGALGTGIVKNTTTTGVLSIAIAGDFPTLNQSTSGNAGTATALAADPSDCGTSPETYAQSIAASGNLTCKQVAYAEVSGTPTLEYQTIQDSGGTPVTQAPVVKFTGTAVTSTATAAGVTTVTLTAGAGGSGCSTTTNNVVQLGDGAAGCKDSSITDNGTTVTSTDTGGYVAPALTDSGLTASAPICTDASKVLSSTCTHLIPIDAVGTSGLSGTTPVAISAAGAISLSGGAGQVPNGATGAFTATPTLGTDNSVAGTLQTANGASNAHTIWGSAATTSNTIKGFATAPTTTDLITCVVATTVCTLTDSGIAVASNKIAISAVGTAGLSGTAPVAISAAGAISLSGSAGQVPNGATGAFTATPTLGASGTLGSLAMGNATSGTVTLNPVTGALGSTTITIPAAVGTGRMAQVICSQVAVAMGTSALGSAAHGQGGTGTCTGATTSDSIQCTSAVQLSGVTGFVPSTSGILTINVWPTANTINAEYLNNTSGSITPGALTINCEVIR